ncbi:MAG TPA: hypothetical protein VF173_16065 [Thermoanaerobaculia bacterium]|nr:hypothetical protein [Thermoanaerobaculia bacterium]
MTWQNRAIEPQWELATFPMQTASPQPQIVTGSVAGMTSGETRDDGSEKIAASAEQEPGAASVLGPASSAARLGAANHAPMSRRTSATGTSF